MDIEEQVPIRKGTAGIRKPRLTVVQQVYHQIPGEEANGPSAVRFYRWLNDDEVGYSRTVKVGEAWQQLDIGWLENKEVSYISLINATKRLPGLTPTQDEVDSHEAKVIEYGIYIGETEGTVGVGYLPPEEGMGFSPISPGKIMIRCQSGEAKLAYFVVPG